MPRKARVVLANCPHHVVQRGHNRQPVFTRSSDYRRYLEELCEWKEAFSCKLYAYCLMSDHVHLIVDPRDCPDSLPRLMKCLAGGYARYVNTIEARSGTLWEGRYRSSPIERERYLLSCCRHVELNPVRRALVDDPQAYPWSSYRAHVGRAPPGVVDLDLCYLELGDSSSQQAARYRAYVAQSEPDGEATLIRAAVQRGQLTGSCGFVDEVARKLGRRIEFRGRGRPRKSAEVVQRKFV